MTRESVPLIMRSELEGVAWRTSTYSGKDNNCVEFGQLRTDRQAVRDSKDRARGALVFRADSWQTFVDGVRDSVI